MVLYDLIIKMPNNGKIVFANQKMNELIKNIKDTLKNSYNIEISKLNNQLIYNIINKRPVNPILSQFVEINKVEINKVEIPKTEITCE
jgi:hypothetical protein